MTHLSEDSGHFLYIIGGDMSNDMTHAHKTKYLDMSAIDDYTKTTSIEFIDITTMVYLVDAAITDFTLTETTINHISSSPFNEKSISGISETFTNIAVFGDPHYETNLASNVAMVIDTQYTCEDSSSPVKVFYSLVDIEGEIVPFWVKFDSSKLTLVLDSTPFVSQSTLYKFGVKSLWGTSSSIKSFYLTVLPCSSEK